jgi:hypothetical protein
MHHLNEEQIEQIREGYYGTHDHHITDDHLFRLSNDQIRYYYAQANLFEEQDRNSLLKGWVIALSSILVVIVIAGMAYGFYAYKKAQPGLHDNEVKSNYGSSTNVQE